MSKNSTCFYIHVLTAWIASKPTKNHFKKRNTYQKSYIDDKGQVTDLGIARSLMGLFDLRLLDVLALAYVASKPVNASRNQFVDLAWEFSITKKSVCDAFRRLSSMELVDNCGLGVFKVSDAGTRSLKAHMPKLSRIDLNRDELFKKQTLNI